MLLLWHLKIDFLVATIVRLLIFNEETNVATKD